MTLLLGKSLFAMTFLGFSHHFRIFSLYFSQFVSIFFLKLFHGSRTREPPLELKITTFYKHVIKLLALWLIGYCAYDYMSKDKHKKQPNKL